VLEKLVHYCHVTITVFIASRQPSSTTRADPPLAAWRKLTHVDGCVCVALNTDILIRLTSHVYILDGNEVTRPIVKLIITVNVRTSSDDVPSATVSQ
jgi:hypothetical protein